MKSKVMKYIIGISLGLFLLTGCSLEGDEISKASDDDIIIITSFYPIYLHTLNITKDIAGVEVINMTEPQVGCLHDYQLSPKDLKVLDTGDVFIINGGGMESFLDKVTDQMPELEIINSSDGIEFIEEEAKGHEGHDHNINPHVWVSVSGAIRQVDNITNNLGKVDIVNKDKYEENGKAYISKLESLKDEMHTELDNLPNKNIVTFHEAFPYFAKEFDFNIVGTILNEEGVEPSAKEIVDIVSEIEKNKVPGIFVEPQYASKSADLISKESGVGIYTLDPIVTGEAIEANIDDYIIRMKENLKEIEEAFR